MSSCHRHHGVDDSRWGAFPEATQPVSRVIWAARVTASGRPYALQLGKAKLPPKTATRSRPLAPAQRRARYAKKLLISGGHHT